MKFLLDTKSVKQEEDEKVEKTRSKSDDNPQENHVKVDYIMITKVKAHNDNKRNIKLTENGSYKNGRQKTITNCKSTFKIRFQSRIFI